VSRPGSMTSSTGHGSSSTQMRRRSCRRHESAGAAWDRQEPGVLQKDVRLTARFQRVHAEHASKRSAARSALWSSCRRTHRMESIPRRHSTGSSRSFSAACCRRNCRTGHRRVQPGAQTGSRFRLLEMQYSKMRLSESAGLSRRSSEGLRAGFDRNAGARAKKSGPHGDRTRYLKTTYTC